MFSMGRSAPGNSDGASIGLTRFVRCHASSLRVVPTGSRDLVPAVGAPQCRNAKPAHRLDPMKHPQPESYWSNVNPVGSRGPYDEAKRFAEATVRKAIAIITMASAPA